MEPPVRNEPRSHIIQRVFVHSPTVPLDRRAARRRVHPRGEVPKPLSLGPLRRGGRIPNGPAASSSLRRVCVPSSNVRALATRGPWADTTISERRRSRPMARRLSRHGRAFQSHPQVARPVFEPEPFQTIAELPTDYHWISCGYGCHQSWVLSHHY